MAEQATTIFGIDLGTTYSCIAYVDDYGRPSTIPNSEGERTTPSVVFFDGDNRIVGKEAKGAATLNPDQIVEMIKRQMGQPDWIYFYEGEEYKPEEISSYILRKLVSDAEMMLGVNITDVVITCPAYFGINEREATAKAGEIAGLNVRSVINEPTAAAIAATQAFPELAETGAGQTVLVYDLGGGTFDVTMIKVKGNEISVIATGGDHNLGGRNWDEIVVSYLASEWMNKSGSSDDPLDDFETLQDLFARAEQAKRALSARDQTDVAVAHMGQRERITFTRDKFNELTNNLLERTIEYTNKMLQEAMKKGQTSFDQILLVGGSTRMPQVAERLKREFGHDPKIFDPDEAVAKGAALFGQKLAIDEEIKIKIESWEQSNSGPVSEEAVRQATQEVADLYGLPDIAVEQLHSMKVTNVTSRSFGVVAVNNTTMQEFVANLIRVNDVVPVSVTQTFGTVEADQPSVEVRIMENIVSDSETTLDTSEELGKSLLDLPARLPANSPIEISFRLDEQGRLHMTAREVTDNRIIEATIETSRVISKEELQEAKARSKQLVVS